ncbi:MAG: electron transport complex subunit RsxC [Clostridia bacterium]|nr:electron transport complex subunit RsxC [Clostridia bacterium]
MIKKTFKRGVHPHIPGGGKKATRDLPIEDYVSDSVVIHMAMNIGAPATPCVKKGDPVKIGQVIGTPNGFMSVPVHASVSGEVTAVEDIPYLGTGNVKAVFIKNDFLNTWEDLRPLGDVEQVDPSLIIPAIRDAGITGMGGASFPTHVKLTFPEGARCDTILVNGAECETHLTADHRLMIEESQRIVNGLRAVMRAVNVPKAIIGIEDNKPEAISAMQEAVSDREGISVQPLKTKYPQGGEKQLIQALTGRQVPAGKLPIDCHVVVLNVGTCAAIADAVTEGKPLVSRITTVTGCVNTPKNLRVPIGTRVEDMIGACDGFSEEPGKIFFGGAMTGIAIPNISTPTAKSTNGIVALNEKDARSLDETACIRCGRCVAACPIGLNPYKIKVAADASDFETAEKLHVMDCMLCGSCAYVCPARRWLTPSFRFAKDKITAERKAKAAKAAAEKGGAHQ